MRKLLLYLFLFSACNFFGQPVSHIQKSLKASRDSLKLLLAKTPEVNGARRLELLNHIYDISITFNDDSIYLFPLWNEAVKQKDINTIDDLSVSMALFYARKGPQDSLNIWIERTKSHMPEPRRTENLEYIHMRRNLWNVNEQDQLAANLIKEQVKVNPKLEPYRAMRILYTLAVIANRGIGNATIKALKTSKEYKAEALAIAQSLPFLDCAHFHGQILLGMSMINADYARQFLTFNQQFLNESHLHHRIFYSRRRIISSLESLIIVGNELPRNELDGYYNNLQQQLSNYPQDTPCAYDQFVARSNYYYYNATDNLQEALRWSDSLITILPKYNLPTHYQKSVRMELLERLGRWEEAYHAAQDCLEIKDSIQAVNIEEKLAELQVQYDVDRLRLEKEKQQQRLLFSIIGCLLLLTIIFFLLYHYYRMRAKNRALCLQIDKYALLIENKQAGILLEQEPTISLPYPSDAAANERLKELFHRFELLMHRDKLYANAALSRDDITKILCINKNKLNQIIQQNTGLNFSEYLTEYRLQQAIIIMKQEPETPVMLIAERVGYGTYSSFYRAFYKRFQIKPTAYKKHLVESQN